jgi:hypothetical protein
MEKHNQYFQTNPKNIHPIPPIPPVSSVIPQEKRNNTAPFPVKPAFSVYYFLSRGNNQLK